MSDQTNKKSQYIIRNENDAYILLKKCYEDKIDFDQEFELKFDGWPKLEIHVMGKQYNGTITPPIMKGLMAFQSSVYRSYALTRYSSVNVNKLTQEEKDLLEIQVRVLSGSSNFSIDFQAILESFVKKIGEKMDAKHTIIIVLCFSAMYFANSSYKSYLDNRKEIRLAESKSQDQKELIQTLKFSSEQETEHIKLIKEISENYHHVSNIKTYSDTSKTAIMKSFKHVDNVVVQGVGISGEEATELVRNARRKPNEIRLDGEYRIMVVDSTDKDGFKIKVHNMISHDEFYAVVQDRTLEKKHLTVIQEAEWSKIPVTLSINATEFGGEIKKAVVIKATKSDGQKLTSR